MMDHIQTGQFEPIHAAHAIEQVVFVVQFTLPLDSAGLSQLRDIVTKNFKADLPGRAEIQGFAFAFGATPSGPVQPGRTVGNVFHRVAPDGSLERELRVEANSITFRTTGYTRWDVVWGEARKYFDALLPTYAVAGSISSISISYVDKFKWSGLPAICDPGLLLRRNSRYLCPTVFDAKDLWHSHTGSFSKVEDNTKRLLNINVDCIDEEFDGATRRVIVIGTVLTDMMNQLGYAPTEIDPHTVNDMVRMSMQRLHDVGKETFGDVINDDMSKRIALIE